MFRSTQSWCIGIFGLGLGCSPGSIGDESGEASRMAGAQPSSPTGANGGQGLIPTPAPGAMPGAPNSGTMMQPGTPNAPGMLSAPVPTPAACLGKAPDVGFAPLRRLTRDQYVNAARDLLKGTTVSPDVLSPDEQIGPFKTNVVGSVSDLVSLQYMEAAEGLAKAAMPKLDAIFPCDRMTAGDAGCADQFIDKVGLRIYRRPLTADEKARYKGGYTTHAAQGGYANGVRVILSVMLQSPNFLYQVEQGVGTGAVVPLDSYSVASRLSFFLWSSMPDDALLGAAAGGQLNDPKALRTQAERMLKDPRAKRTLASFHEQWLGLGALPTLSKDLKAYPGFTATLRSSMAAETGDFADAVIREGDGRLATLFSAATSPTADPALRKLYSAGAPGADGQVALPVRERSGLLTQAGFLATHAGTNQSSPVRRGVAIIKNVMCATLPDPPAGVNAVAPDPSPTLTTRQRFEEHEKSPSCSGCHKLIDGVGLGFENYDGMGTYRSTENGKTVDSRGELVIGDAATVGAFSDAVALAKKLSVSPDVATCTAKQWMRFALGRGETTADGCSVQGALAAFTGSQNNVRDLLTSITTTDAFRYRRAAK